MSTQDKLEQLQAYIKSERIKDDYREASQLLKAQDVEGLLQFMKKVRDREASPPETYKTKSGRILTDEDIQALADEAEKGYDVSELGLGRKNKHRIPNPLTTAVKLAAQVHADQRDLVGEEYILHCLAVMRKMGPYGTDAMIIGVLHDVLEDAEDPDAVKTVLYACYGDDVCRALDVLTRQKNQTYEDYIAGIINGPPKTRLVKIADLEHNLDESRKLSTPLSEGERNKHQRRRIKYEIALKQLKDSLWSYKKK